MAMSEQGCDRLQVVTRENFPNLSDEVGDSHPWVDNETLGSLLGGEDPTIGGEVLGLHELENH